MDKSLRDQIEKKAYEKFVSRGQQHGNHLDDWLEAEQEVLEEIQSTKTKMEEQVRRTPAKMKKRSKKR